MSMKPKQKKAILTTLSVVLVILVTCSLCIGNYKISFASLVELLHNKMVGSSYDTVIESILLNIRLVRIIAAITVGAALATSGLVYQTVFSNNMVSPDLLGVSSSAACGAAIAILLGLPKQMNFIFSFAFSIVAIVLTGVVSKLLHRKDGLLLAGIIIAGFAKSGLGLLKYIADSENGELESIVYWEMGSMAKVSWKELGIVQPLIIIIIIVIYFSRRRISCLVFGESASLLGVCVSIEKICAIAGASLLVSLSTSMCGVISWVSLIIPIASAQLTRSGSITDNIGVTALLGGIFLLISDDICRTATASEIPISIMTGAAGLIVFCVSVFSKKGRKKHESSVH